MIPKATILSAVAVGLFWVVIATVLSNAVSPDVYTEAIERGGSRSALRRKLRSAKRAASSPTSWGLKPLLLSPSAHSSAALESFTAWAGDGVISPRFGAVHPKFKTPWFSITAVTVFVVVVDTFCLRCIYRSAWTFHCGR